MISSIRLCSGISSFMLSSSMSEYESSSVERVSLSAWLFAICLSYPPQLTFIAGFTADERARRGKQSRLRAASSSATSSYLHVNEYIVKQATFGPTRRLPKPTSECSMPSRKRAVFFMRNSRRGFTGLAVSSSLRSPR